MKLGRKLAIRHVRTLLIFATVVSVAGPTHAQDVVDFRGKTISIIASF